PRFPTRRSSDLSSLQSRTKGSTVILPVEKHRSPRWVWSCRPFKDARGVPGVSGGRRLCGLSHHFVSSTGETRQERRSAAMGNAQRFGLVVALALNGGAVLGQVLPNPYRIV